MLIRCHSERIIFTVFASLYIWADKGVRNSPASRIYSPCSPQKVSVVNTLDELQRVLA